MKFAVAVAVGTGLVAGCAPVKKEEPPEISALGIGIVESVVLENGDDGESAGTRAAVGFVAGGLPTMAGALATEEHLSRTTKWRYDVVIDGLRQSFLSHAALAKGDCVEVERIHGSALTVLTRIDRRICQRPR